MTTWADFHQQAPELAQRAEFFLREHKFLTMATLRRDGSPRIAGTEMVLKEGRLLIAGMGRARRFEDLRRDPRMALHSGTADEEGWTGDAKITALAIERNDDAGSVALVSAKASPGDFEVFELDVREVAVMALNEGRTAMTIDSWRVGEEVKHVER